MAFLARIETLSSAMDRKPPPTAAATQPWPTVTSCDNCGKIRTTLPGARMPSTGEWPVSRPMSPSSVLAITSCAWPAQISPSGTTSRTFSTVSPCVTPSRPFQLPGLALDVLDPAAHEERLLGHVVELALGDRLERRDGLLQRDELARLAGELLGHIHRVRQEPLDSPGPLHRHLVLFGQLVDAEDGDDVLEFLVPLEHPLH